SLEGSLIRRFQWHLHVFLGREEQGQRRQLVADCDWLHKSLGTRAADIGRTSQWFGWIELEVVRVIIAPDHGVNAARIACRWRQQVHKRQVHAGSKEVLSLAHESSQ